MKSQLLEQASGAFSAAFRKNVIERIEPFARFYDFESVCRLILLRLLRLQRISHSDLTPVGDGIFYDKQSAEILLKEREGRRSEVTGGSQGNDGCCERPSRTCTIPASQTSLDFGGDLRRVLSWPRRSTQRAVRAQSPGLARAIREPSGRRRYGWRTAES